MAYKRKHQKADRRWIVIVPLILLVIVCMCLLNKEVIYKLNTSTQNLAVDSESESKGTSKNNPDSYWSEDNEPVFYGATKITLVKDCINEFNIKDSRFRIFARDFEDGDLTQNIIASGSVDVHTAGEYEITYRVTDSHSNEKVLVVPVSVVEVETEGTDAESGAGSDKVYTKNIVVERTLYTNPDVSNIAGKANSEDMQTLGVYLPANANIIVRPVAPTTNVVLTMVSNEKSQESTHNITGMGSSYGKSIPSVPFIKTASLARGQDIAKTEKIIVEYNEDVEALDYYHYGDMQSTFVTNWTMNEFAVLENEEVTIIVPYSAKNRMTGTTERSFRTLDEMLTFYKKVANKRDELMNLSLNPSNMINQNARVKSMLRENTSEVYIEMNLVALKAMCYGNSSLAQAISEDKTIYPVIEPTPEPTLEPIPIPTDEPIITPEPTYDVTPDPTWDPTWDPTLDPTPDITPEPTWEPTPEPTQDPWTWEPEPTPTPYQDPYINNTPPPNQDTMSTTTNPVNTPVPTKAPKIPLPTPTVSPTPEVTPTEVPTAVPSDEPTENSELKSVVAGVQDRQTTSPTTIIIAGAVILGIAGAIIFFSMKSEQSGKSEK